jgi:ribulose-phosphate 3-epimerase
MDGHFVPNLTFGPKMVADLRRATALPLDVHLMIERPEDWVLRYAEAGATSLTIHIESTEDPAGTIAAIRAAGVRPGVTLRPGTDLARILPLIGQVDLVLVMSVEPGFGGQAFIPGSLDRVRTLRAALDAGGSRADLQVDGGVKVENAGALAVAGATVLVAGSAVFNDPAGPRAALAKLRAAAGA